MMAGDVRILVVGQSNAAGFGATAHTAGQYVNELTDGYNAAYSDPIVWGDHDSNPNWGSIWGRVGDKLVQTGVVSTVGFEVIAVGSSSVFNWDEQHAASNTPVRGYLCAARLANALNDYPWDAVIWQQGEQDTVNGTSLSGYQTALQHIIDKIRTHTAAPVLVCLSSYAFGATSQNVRAAQLAAVLARQGSNVWLSFDMDHIVPAAKRRSDDVHLNADGLAACANAWFAALLPFLR